MKMFRIKLVTGILSALFVLLSIQVSHAGSATWALNPQSGDWNDPANWVPPTVPNGPNDVARFGVSNITNILISADVQVNSIVFMPGASPCNLGSYAWNQWTMNVTNNSGIIQNFVIAGDGIPGDVSSIQFMNSATAGNLTVYTNEGATVNGQLGGVTEFFNTANAGGATLIANGGTITGAGGGNIVFHDTSTAANATLMANGGANGGDGGTIQFLNGSQGGTAELSGCCLGDGWLDLESHDPPGLTIGSIEGSGQITLGANNLTVGSNNLSTTFSGTIAGTDGSLTKIGTGTLTLSGANTYTGATTVNAGTLLLQKNGNTSQTGTGNVVVRAGTLGGDGIAAGNVNIGNGSSPRASISSGCPYCGILMDLKKKLTFKSDGDYDWQINSSDLTFGSVTARGVTIVSGAQFLATEIGTGTFPQGTVLTIIKNTSQLPISGTFGNLPDGTLLTVGANTILISYHGGTRGRDLIGTVQ